MPLEISSQLMQPVYVLAYPVIETISNFGSSLIQRIQTIASDIFDGIHTFFAYIFSFENGLEDRDQAPVISSSHPDNSIKNPRLVQKLNYLTTRPCMDFMTHAFSEKPDLVRERDLIRHVSSYKASIDVINGLGWSKILLTDDQALEVLSPLKQSSIKLLATLYKDLKHAYNDDQKGLILINFRTKIEDLHKKDVVEARKIISLNLYKIFCELRTEGMNHEDPRSYYTHDWIQAFINLFDRVQKGEVCIMQFTNWLELAFKDLDQVID